MKTTEISYAEQAARLDPMFLWHLIGALSVKDKDWLETTALEYMEVYHKDALETEKNKTTPLTSPSA